jgi:hypothetical protein
MARNKWIQRLGMRHEGIIQFKVQHLHSVECRRKKEIPDE